jgi:hypothetical protein
MKRSFRSFPLLLLLPVGLAISASCSPSNGAGDGGALGGNPFLITGSAPGIGGTVGGPSGGSSSGDDIGDPNGGVSSGSGGETSGLACPSFGVLECGSMALRPSVVGANVLVVLDRSGSMDLIVDEAKQTELWSVVTSALTTSLNEATEAISFGLELFPMSDTGPVVKACAVGSDTSPCCAVPSEGVALEVPVAAGAENRGKITELLGRVGYGGGTPTAAALQRAYEYYSTGAGKDLQGQRFVMLTTDGGPNCNFDLTCEKEECTRNIDKACTNLDLNCCDTIDETALEPPQAAVFDIPSGCLDDEGTLEQVEALREIGVETFVIGLPGSELYGTQLNAFAEAGGRARLGEPEKYYKVDAAGANEGLLAVFRDITTQLIKSCDVPLDHAILDQNQLNVAVDCTLIPGVDPPVDGAAGSGTAATDGWWFDSTTAPGMVRIQGPICDKIESEGAERIDLLEGCDTFE